MRISDWSSDVCSSDLSAALARLQHSPRLTADGMESFTTNLQPRIEVLAKPADFDDWTGLPALLRESFAYMEGRIDPLSSLHRLDASKLAVKAMEEELVLAYVDRSEEHTSETQSLMRTSYAVF